MNISEIFVEMMERIARLEQRVAAGAMHGPVTDVDTKKQVARVRLGGTDEEPWKSPWIPYGQFAGALKVHTPPTVGQNMTLFNPTGDPAQGVLLPFTWNNTFSSPSDKDDENVLTYGNVRIEIKNDRVFVKVGGSEITITGEKMTVKSPTEFDGDYVKHKGRKIDRDHKHRDVQPGSGLTGIPNE
ncbi:MAG: phage baseplate assembly protein V [Beijerinckiaceae bacterium]